MTMIFHPMCYILLNSIEKVEQFIGRNEKCDYDINIVVGSRIIDGKSIVGILSLDLTKPVGVHINREDKLDEFKSAFSDFLV